MTAFFLGAFGSLALEFLNLRELYGKLHSRRFQLLIKCPAFWAFSASLVVMSGVFTWVVHDGQSPQQEWLATMLVGAGFRSFGREGMGAAVHNKAIVQGGDDDRITLRDILA